jgi:biotin operon repressor
MSDPEREPFVMVPTVVGETILGTLGPSAFAVYWHLSKRSKDGVSWPSLDDIAESVSLSRMHVTRMVKALEADGWITREQRTNQYGMATSTLYRLTHKPCTNGCNIPVTSREHDTPFDVTRTRVKLDLNKIKETAPLPPKPNGAAADYQTIIGEPTYGKVAAQFTALAPQLSPGWLSATLAAAAADLGPASRDQLREALTGTVADLSRRLAAERGGNGKPISNLKAFARAVVVGNLRDTLGATECTA